MGKRKDVGPTNSESTAVIEYRVPAVPAPVPTLFKTDPPALAHVSAPLIGHDQAPLGDAQSSEAPGHAPEAPHEAAAAHIDAAPDPAKAAPVMPPAATLQELPGIDASRMSESPSVVPEEAAAAPPPFARAPVPAAVAPPRSSRFALLAASVALAASVGAVAGSLGDAELQRHLVGTVAAPRNDIPEDVHGLKDTVAQLRANVKTLSESVAAMRASMTASNATVNGQLSKITEALDRGDRRAAAAAAPPAAAPPASADTTGSIAVPASGELKPPAKPPIVEGWAIRKVYDGAALIEGRYGIVEVEPGMNLPGLGRIQEIRRQDGHWVVVTPKGLIMPIH